jgi:ammonia channel protein AmtB
MGTILTGLFAKVKGVESSQLGAVYSHEWTLFIQQIAAVVFTLSYSSLMTLAILGAVYILVGLEHREVTGQASAEDSEQQLQSQDET